MLEKLRSRHPIDLPTEGFGPSRGLLATIGSIAVLFLLLPLAGAFAAGVLTAPVAVALGLGTLVLVVIVGAARGKPGHRRKR